MLFCRDLALRRLPLSSALAFSLPRLALWAARAVRYGYVREYLAGLRGLAQAVPKLLTERVPISRETRAQLARIRSQSSGPLLQ